MNDCVTRLLAHTIVMHAVKYIKIASDRLTSSSPVPASVYCSSLTQVQFPDGKRTLCLIPARFHKKLWIKRGNYLIVENVEEADAAVTGQIINVLFTDHVKQLKKLEGVWPTEFAESNSISTVNSALDINSAEDAAAELEQLSLNSKEGTSNGGDAEPSAAGEQQGEATAAGDNEGSENSYSSSDDDLPPIVKIQNRRIVDYQVSESESDEEEEGKAEEEV
jgi:Translation initiation factor 1A / IF-1